MAQIDVKLTRHLFAFFPQLEGKALQVEADTVAEVVQALDAMAPGIAHYICDERGRLRPHVNAFIDNEMVRDRRALGDGVQVGQTVHILQSLSGG